MEGLSGIDLCKTIKDDESLKHIPGYITDRNFLR
jgi:hypothetical protein